MGSITRNKHNPWSSLQVMLHSRSGPNSVPVQDVEGWTNRGATSSTVTASYGLARPALSRGYMPRWLRPAPTWTTEWMMSRLASLARSWLGIIVASCSVVRRALHAHGEHCDTRKERRGEHGNGVLGF